MLTSEDIVCLAIDHLARKLVGSSLEKHFADMGAAWNLLTADSQLRWCV